LADAADPAIVGVYLTEQSKRSGRRSIDLMHEALMGGLADAGLRLEDVDAYCAVVAPNEVGLGVTPGNIARQLGQPISATMTGTGAEALLYARGLLQAGTATTVAIVHGYAQSIGVGEVAAYTTPGFEFTYWTGSYTAAQFALQARRYMHEFGMTEQQLAYGPAIIRNAGMVNPAAVMFGRGPYGVDDILNAPMIADPLTLLMCSLANDGGSCVIVTTAERANDCCHAPVWVRGGAVDHRYAAYHDPPTLEILQSRPKFVAAIERTGISHSDVDMVQIYDHFAIGVPMALEALGFCEVGDGGDFVVERCGFGEGLLPISTDGGCQSHSHPMSPHNHKVIEAVSQLRGTVADRCPEWASGVHTYDPARCRRVRDPKHAIACGQMTGGYSFAVLGSE
jgi:acetyl-CoA acetyltransferase